MIQFSFSPAYILLLLPIALLLAWWFYKKSNFKKTTRILLVSLRFLSLFLLGILLLQPVLHYMQRNVIQPKIAFLVDNSQSIIASSQDSVRFINDFTEFQNNFKQQLSDKFDIDFYTFDQQIASNETPDFKGIGSNIAAPILQLQSNYLPEELHKVILVSDGIANQGLDPKYIEPSFLKIDALLLGDTAVKADVSIEKVSHNNIAYKGNTFPVSISWSKTHRNQFPATLRIFEGDKNIAEQSLNLNNQQGNATIWLNAEKEGNHLYKVEISHSETDINIANNVQYFTVKVQERKNTIALVYGNPTPDVGAFNQALAQFEDFETQLWSLNDFYKADYTDFDAILLFLNENVNAPKLQAVVKQYKKGVGVWVFVQNAQHAAAFNQLKIFPQFQLEQNSAQENLVYPLENKAYTGQVLDEAWTQVDILSPLKAKLGTPEFSAAYQHLFFQQIGTLKTELPLLSSFQNTSGKGLVCISWDWWKLRMSFYQQFNSHAAFDNWVAKRVQFLVADASKKQLKINIPDNFNSTQSQKISAQLTTVSGDPIIGAVISLQINAAEGSQYDYEFIASNQQYLLHLNGLPVGSYTYTAKTKVEGKEQVASGNFVILPGNVEMQNLTANHNALKNLAAKSGGKSYYFTNKQQLLDDLLAEKATNRMESNLRIDDIVSWKWICFAIALLLAAEWFLRKQNGAQ